MINEDDKLDVHKIKAEARAVASADFAMEPSLDLIHDMALELQVCSP